MAERTFGPAYDAAIDGERIATQMEVIREHMLRRRGWVTLREVALATNNPEASVSAQLRHLRKPRFGGFEVTKRRRDGAGTWEYRLEPAFRLTP
jgi:hypothetical protein